MSCERAPANLAIVFGVVYAASLAATFLLARRSRVYPAEALRYQ